MNLDKLFLFYDLLIQISIATAVKYHIKIPHTFWRQPTQKILPHHVGDIAQTDQLKNLKETIHSPELQGNPKQTRNVFLVVLVGLCQASLRDNLRLDLQRLPVVHNV